MAAFKSNDVLIWVFNNKKKVCKVKLSLSTIKHHDLRTSGDRRYSCTHS